MQELHALLQPQDLPAVLPAKESAPEATVSSSASSSTESASSASTSAELPTTVPVSAEFMDVLAPGGLCSSYPIFDLDEDEFCTDPETCPCHPILDFDEDEYCTELDTEDAETGSSGPWQHLPYDSDAIEDAGQIFRAEHMAVYAEVLANIGIDCDNTLDETAFCTCFSLCVVV